MADRSDTSTDQPQPGARGYDAFLSYSSSDAVRVKRVQRFLETYKDKDSGRKLRVFLDQTDIRGGSLRPEIESALAASRFLIVCLLAGGRRLPLGQRRSLGIPHLPTEPEHRANPARGGAR